jgi:hypothetical protein
MCKCQAFYVIFRTNHEVLILSWLSDGNLKPFGQFYQVNLLHKFNIPIIVMLANLRKPLERFSAYKH